MKKPKTCGELIWVAAAMVALSGCATGPAFTVIEAAPAGQAQVYLYRPWRFPGSATTLKISIDGVRTESTLPNSSWERLTVSPGRHGIGLKEYLNTFSCGSTQVYVEAGQTVFVEVDFTMSSPDGTRTYIGCGMKQRDEQTAMKDIAGMRRSKQ